ncbi:hypothetical protein GCM10010112_65630 [Actinoplanes lobatus]|uniref:Uncharacterized protein n=2 Tax=Actinoplanes lobatus TaxID=113568 RepID=A0ABQ4ATG8_9ACTN|nr:hypothetical protein GCM10010112_65630 [Actinoplanes lobatus]GIE44312.1 hypothetical protein Alo02nite_72100 [Actinoplanes lobatus]
MGEVYPMPTVGEVFTDVRGDGRTMRVSYHENRQVVVVSLWADAVCRGSFQLAADEVGRLTALLAQVAPATAEVPSPLPSPEQTGDVSMLALPTALTPRVA